MATRITRKEEAYNRLKSAIISGEVGPGEKLSENDLSASMSISRTPIREAFRQLQMEGYITVISNRGAFVSKLPTDEIEEIYDIISILEGYAAELATKNLIDSNLDKLKNLQQKLLLCATEKRYRDYVEKNTEFHRFITEMSGNLNLAKTVTELRSRVFRYRFTSVTIPGFLDKYAGDHDRIIEAIRQRDHARARKYMTAHVLFVKEVLVSFLRDQGGN
ncbi:MAG: GntR family transcriptional regulator [Desulfobacteraceae bacterium]|jgi:DNA-binding GntR family transcriptional regulator|nr:MAG: GntR family transcriptional regulator [Desulfobacteraceae bacterium]